MLPRATMTVRSAETRIGVFHILAGSSGVVRITFPGPSPAELIDRADPQPDHAGQAIAAAAAEQIEQYLSGARRGFDVPLRCTGLTQFQEDVYQALMQVPYGEVVSYGELAEMAGRPLAARAVGTAMRKNPIALIIPCHRVVGSRGAPGGWSGPEGLKEHLLALESRTSTRR